GKGRSPCCDEDGLKKGQWTPEEDKKLVDYIQKNGHGSLRALPKLAGLNRCGSWTAAAEEWEEGLKPAPGTGIGQESDSGGGGECCY
ncbi:unnamed protein product, partial [Linum tenue]